MARTISPETDQLQVSLLLRRYGWSQITLTTPDLTETFIVSEMFSDVVANLVRLCDALIAICATTVPFHDEPGGCTWTLIPIPARRHTVALQVRAIEHDENSIVYGAGTAVLEVIVKRAFLSTILVGELWKNALLFGEPSFQRDRLAFPVDVLNRLTQRWTASGLAPAGFRPPL